MDTLSYKTKSANKDSVVRKWHIVDAESQVVGRMCSKIAHILRGKHKPSYTPHVDTGDCVIVINADKLRFTGNKVNDKVYLTYSGYPGGQKKRTVREQLDRDPRIIIEKAVKGMLPKNKLGRAMYKKLFVYTGGEHPHQAQQPAPLKID
ncbi:MAG: 50S ribosomal protein L13 [Bacteroidia bacterium]|nr:50S ribosomal protein L13 [Bacteroidia bacterium]